ncbi:MAG TPA: ion channel [Actinomycetota bacterium]|nr:ion channel [Actinomycetota bacterium]
MTRPRTWLAGFVNDLLQIVIPDPPTDQRADVLWTWYGRLVFALLQVIPWIVLLRAGGLTDQTASLSASVALVMYMVLTAAVWTKVLRASTTGNRRRLFFLIFFGLNMFVVAFTSVYWHLSQTDRACFSDEMTRLDAGYFTLTTLTTTGYGDIRPVTAVCRAFVTAQMAAGAVIVSGVLAVAVTGYTSARRTRTEAPHHDR